MLSSSTINDSKDVEAQLLYHSVVPLRLADTRKAASTAFDAFLKDPLIVYLRTDEKPSPGVNKILNAIVLTQWRRTKVVLTVDAGSAIVVATPPEAPMSPIDRLTDFLLSCLISVLRKTRSRESRKRTKEATEKIKAVVSATLGDRLQTMIYVNLLATDPQSQGHGYGGALLEAVASFADMTGQAAWLESSNINNTEFYMSHGFKTVGEACLGYDNPEWQGKPIIVPIMVREPQKRSLIVNTPSYS